MIYLRWCTPWACQSKPMSLSRKWSAQKEIRELIMLYKKQIKNLSASPVMSLTESIYSLMNTLSRYLLLFTKLLFLYRVISNTKIKVSFLHLMELFPNMLIALISSWDSLSFANLKTKQSNIKYATRLS